jgi:hypothetical protein
MNKQELKKDCSIEKWHPQEGYLCIAGTNRGNIALFLYSSKFAKDFDWFAEYNDISDLSKDIYFFRIRGNFMKTEE